MSKMSKRERSKQESINKIIKTTKKMILEGSYFTTTTRHIARVADVSVGLIYKYFPKGKPEIAFEICKLEYSEFLSKINVPLLTLKEVPEFIHEILKKLVQFHKERAKLIAAFDIAFLSKENYEIDFDEEEIFAMNPIPTILKQLFNETDNNNLKKLNTILLNTIESIIHRDLNYSKIFDTDDELVDFLVYLTMKILQYKFK